jgi:hypothetical protein
LLRLEQAWEMMSTLVHVIPAMSGFIDASPEIDDFEKLCVQ